MTQSSRPACSAQKPSGSSIERWYIARYLAASQCAALATASGTGKTSLAMASSDFSPPGRATRMARSGLGVMQP